MKQIKVWDLQTRIFHWSLVVYVFCALITADMPRAFGFKTIASDVWLAFHIGAGVGIGILLIFRIFWGFAGSDYSRFAAFNFSVPELIKYLRVILKNQKTSYYDHNPGASWSVAGIIFIGIATVITGTLVFALDEGRGILNFLYRDFYQNAMSMKRLHHMLAYILSAIIIAHIAGVVMETLRFKTGIIRAMFTGKRYTEEENCRIKKGIFLTTVSFIWIVLPLPAFFYIYNEICSRQPDLIQMPVIYKQECAACHMAFPPNILPAKSWQTMMSNLDDHFGDDASCDEETRKQIEDFLVKNSAETSIEEAAIKFQDSIDKNNPLRITASGFWKRKHDDIPPEIYKRESIKNRVNCVACHKWAEYGSFEDNDIRIPH